jgi:hypothetical protein
MSKVIDLYPTIPKHFHSFLQAIPHSKIADIKIGSFLKIHYPHSKDFRMIEITSKNIDGMRVTKSQHGHNQNMAWLPLNDATADWIKDWNLESPYLEPKFNQAFKSLSGLKDQLLSIKEPAYVGELPFSNESLSADEAALFIMSKIDVLKGEKLTSIKARLSDFYRLGVVTKFGRDEFVKSSVEKLVETFTSGKTYTAQISLNYMISSKQVERG